MRVAGAVDIGGTRTKIGIVAARGRIVRRTAIPTPGRDPRALVDAIGTALRPLLAQTASGDLAPVIGVSVAGFLDPARSAMIANANLPALCGFPLRRALEDRLGRECRLEVDSNAAVVAEYRHGAGRGAARLLGVTIGTGLGGGVIAGGALLRFTGQCAGDLGHILVHPGGRRCTCGARGCLEAMVNAPALAERAGGRPVAEILEAARRGDRNALDALAETGRWLGLGLASLVALFAPDRIVIGGGVAAAGPLLLEPVGESYREHAAPAFRDTPLVASEFDGWEGMVGAGSLAIDPL